ncbi:FolC bifunctional protein [Lizonia empirigonia]|nr:FolC bifunctional protein [Lizonia empirigonia]
MSLFLCGYRLLIEKAALEALNRLHEFRARLGPRRTSASAKARTQEWLEVLGVNQQRLNSLHVIHVAGTKGKGSTCLFCESMLMEYRSSTDRPLKVGCLTSPHVTDIRERIKLNGSPISKDLFANYFFEIWEQIKQHTQREGDGPRVPGYPGFLALMGLYAFVQEGVDVAIIETGIGGENDSTNVIRSPTVTGITTIGLDHVNVLGDSLDKIAWHKAGIFKEGSPAYTVEQDSSVLEVLRTRAVEKRVFGQLQVVSEQLANRYAATVKPDMPFQRRNASLAIALVETCLKALRPEFRMTPQIANSLTKTELPGRSQIIKEEKLEWFVTSAHNELSIDVVASWYSGAIKSSESPDIPRVLIFSHESQRDSKRMLQRLHDVLHQDDKAAITQAIFSSVATGLESSKLDFFDPRKDTHTTESAQQHARWWREIDERANSAVVESLADAIMLVRRLYASSGATILIAGSVYQAGATNIILDNRSMGSKAGYG